MYISPSEYPSSTFIHIYIATVLLLVGLKTTTSKQDPEKEITVSQPLFGGAEAQAQIAKEKLDVQDNLEADDEMKKEGTNAQIGFGGFPGV